MAAIVLLRNPLTPHTREQYPLAAGTPVIDWLQENHPRGFGMPIRFYVNGEETPLDDLDYAVAEDDVAVIALMPAEPISLTTIGISLLISAVLSVATYFAMRAFMPQEQKGKSQQTSVYDVSGDQNGARIGDPVPVLYGNAIYAPDYISQPYTWYDWSQDNYQQAYNGVQYLDMLMCVGQGNIAVEKVFVGDTDSSTLPAGVLTWYTFRASQHLKTMGTIASAIGNDFHENVVTSPEVGNQEFVKTGDLAGYFAACKPGNKGRFFEIDITFPQGQTNPTDGGNVKGRTTTFRVYWLELDDNDVPVGTEVSKVIVASTESATVVTSANGGTVTTTSTSEKNRTQIGAPIRRSYKIDTGRSARWSVRIERITVAPDATNGADRFLWTGLKLYADYQAGTVYGDITILAVRIKASQGLSNEAAIRVRVKAQRLLSPPGGGAEVSSRSGSDAFGDVYTNAVYGADRPPSELDVSTLTALRTKWSAYEFNYVFRDRVTVWEALRTITTPFGAEPLPMGAVMSIAKDGVKNVRSMLFTDANILSDSMSIQYSFDDENAADGVEIEYLNPLDFRQSYSLYPSTALQPDRFTVPGITNATHAAQYARLTWQRGQLQRKRIRFDTELEGLILQLGDRIGVAHNVPKWGVSGNVISVSGGTLTVDKMLDWAGGLKSLLLRRPDGSVTGLYAVTRGARDNDILLPSPIPGDNPLPTINVDNGSDYTSFAFGTSSTIVRDFIVISAKPNGDKTVTVEAVNYDPNLYVGAMSYMVT